MNTPRKLLRDTFVETGSPVRTIRRLRERYGISFEDARTLWLGATGTAPPLQA